MSDDIWKKAAAKLKTELESPAFQAAFRAIEVPTKRTFKTLNEVWEAIDAGKTVHWESDAYALTVETEVPEMAEWRERHGYARPFSQRGDKTLRVTCTANYFGSLLEASELSRLYTKD